MSQIHPETDPAQQPEPQDVPHSGNLPWGRGGERPADPTSGGLSGIDHENEEHIQDVLETLPPTPGHLPEAQGLTVEAPRKPFSKRLVAAVAAGALLLGAGIAYAATRGSHPSPAPKVSAPKTPQAGESPSASSSAAPTEKAPQPTDIIGTITENGITYSVPRYAEGLLVPAKSGTDHLTPKIVKAWLEKTNDIIQDTTYNDFETNGQINMNHVVVADFGALETPGLQQQEAADIVHGTPNPGLPVNIAKRAAFVNGGGTMTYTPKDIKVTNATTGTATATELWRGQSTSVYTHQSQDATGEDTIELGFRINELDKADGTKELVWQVREYDLSDAHQVNP